MSAQRRLKPRAPARIRYGIRAHAFGQTSSGSGQTRSLSDSGADGICGLANPTRSTSTPASASARA